MIKLTILYGHPTDPVAFERYYAETHLPLAAKIEGLRRTEYSKAIAPADGSPAPFYRIAELWFESLADLQAVMATPEAQATAADIANFATGGATRLISEVA